MKEKPIIFNTEMVKAVLAGKKTQTRRVIKPQPKYIQVLNNGKIETSNDGGFDCDVKYIKYPYEVDQTLWVRETWYECINNNDRIYYHASEIPLNTDQRKYKKRPSIFLSRKDARLFLKVKNIRLERIQDISESDSILEGCPEIKGSCTDLYISAKDNYSALWDIINKKRGYGWDKNPYVWIIDFEVDKDKKK